MRKLIVTCECGQRLRVPYSALGKTGVCVTCGRTIQIMSGNTRREGFNQRIEPSVLRESHWPARAGRTILSEEDRQRFGKAVDLYAKQQYAEALAIFDSFLEQFPGNPEIEEARNQCLRALRRPRLGAPQGAAKPPGETKLDADTVKRVVLERMLNDPSGATQIEAARLACQILGISGDGSAANEATQAASAPSTATAQESAAPGDGRDVSSLDARGQEEPTGIPSRETDSE
jgi:hypothetical protein